MLTYLTYLCFNLGYVLPGEYGTHKFSNMQWRIQDFLEGDANSQSECANLL